MHQIQVHTCKCRQEGKVVVLECLYLNPRLEETKLRRLFTNNKSIPLIRASLHFQNKKNSIWKANLERCQLILANLHNIKIKCNTTNRTTIKR